MVVRRIDSVSLFQSLVTSGMKDLWKEKVLLGNNVCEFALRSVLPVSDRLVSGSIVVM